MRVYAWEAIPVLPILVSGLFGLLYMLASHSPLLFWVVFWSLLFVGCSVYLRHLLCIVGFMPCLGCSRLVLCVFASIRR